MLVYTNNHKLIRGEANIADLYAKRTDTFDYVPLNPSHPRHTLRNIPFSLAILVRGIVSDPILLQVRLDEMKKTDFKRIKNTMYSKLTKEYE